MAWKRVNLGNGDLEDGNLRNWEAFTAFSTQTDGGGITACCAMAQRRGYLEGCDG